MSKEFLESMSAPPRASPRLRGRHRVDLDLDEELRTDEARDLQHRGRRHVIAEECLVGATATVPVT
jgi:hypothetical protein